MEERLPDWVKEGKVTRDFLAWLKGSEDNVMSFSGYVLLKVTVRSCVLIYTAGEESKEETKQVHSLALSGILRKKDCALYEVSPVLYQAVGIPKEFGFPDKSHVQAELEEKVTLQGRERIKQEWDQLVLKSGVTKEQLIPVIDRVQIHAAARRYFQMGKRAAHLIYLPRFSFAAIQSELSDEVLLKYLEDEESAVALVTDWWLMHGLSDISKKRIYYGCVQEEMAEMEKSGYAKGNSRKGQFAA